MSKEAALNAGAFVAFTVEPSYIPPPAGHGKDTTEIINNSMPVPRIELRCGGKLYQVRSYIISFKVGFFKDGMKEVGVRGEVQLHCSSYNGQKC